jgi:hypothetical protein
VAQPGDAPRPAVGAGDWTAQAADSIERVVAGIRGKTSVPLTTVARALVYGLVAGLMGILCLVFVAIVAVRILSAYVVQREVWAAYLVVGGIFVLPGVFLLRKATSAKASKGSGRA